MSSDIATKITTFGFQCICKQLLFDTVHTYFVYSNKTSTNINRFVKTKVLSVVIGLNRAAFGFQCIP